SARAHAGSLRGGERRGGGRVGRSGLRLIDPEAKAAEKRSLVVPEPAVRWKLAVEGLRCRPSSLDVGGQQAGSQPLDALDHGLAPALVPEPRAPSLAHVLLERCLA